MTRCSYRNRHRGRRGMGAVAGFALLAALGILPAAAGAETVRVVQDADGQRLQIDGRDVLVYGVNWDYVPIGENYNYSLWNQPDDVIMAALAREMPLLQDLGVNVIRQYVGVPPRWVRYIYEQYGIRTVLNHTVARYGFTLDGTWIPAVDYSDPRLRAAVKAEVAGLVDEFRDTPGLLMWLLGNENNYGLSWSSFEIEALPVGERDAARARHLYSLFDEIIREIQQRDPAHPVAIANGDLQYVDIIAEECPTLDVFGANVYRGISARDLFDVVAAKLGVPVLFTEFGADAWNAREMREDQSTQARYLIGQWREIYEQTAGKGRAGNAIGGLVFQWSDGWWKYRQEERLEIHDTNASWPNGGYAEDFVEGENNMNEEWWGITAKGRPDHRGLYEVYPRAAYYALRQAFALDPYAKGADLAAIRAHFATIRPVAAEVQARGDRAALAGESRERVHLSGLRMEFETFSTGGDLTTTPPAGQPQSTYPAFRGFDHLQSFYVDAEVRPAENVQGNVSLNILGNVPVNPIDEILYENRGRRRTIAAGDDVLELESLERVALYNASVTWDDRWFQLDAFYRAGHLHWGHEGDFFGLYRNAYYGENIDIYNGMAPVGVEIDGKRALSGLTFAFGPQLWWGANPAIFVKYRRQVGPFDATAVYHEDIAPQSTVTTSIAIPLPETRKISLQAVTAYGPFGIELGTLWSGSTKLDQPFQIADPTPGGYRILQDTIKGGDTWGFKAKLTLERGRWHWYGQGAYMGLVADAGPTETITYTGWNLEDSGSGNQKNVLTGVAVNVGRFQIGPNVLWQKPVIGPVPGDAPAPGRPRNVLDDPFAVRGNRETFGTELLVTFDPTPATWMWAWDNDVREDARLAAALGFVYRDHRTTQDAAIFIAEDGRTTYPFPGAPPAEDLWEMRARVVSRLGPQTRLVANVYGGMVEPNGWNPTADQPALNRFLHRYGMDARITHGPLAFATFVKVNDWGPYDYHRDFNLTFPLQLMGDVSYSLGSPRWFGYPQTRLGVRGKWRSLDHFSPRYSLTGGVPGLLEGEPHGSEWEIQTYLHLSL
ncbi:MAG TPA: glycosidase [Candidatus Krumholzibacteria bacterium]|nr:glycosidase [Candidatus Krumholzibacteria bacterium]HPD70210.1 glycosidase [Candidatus Krumholzibacteria bacterium]HRY40090.1 glycosidase [Candidatus Krumholzibacteria bacterium]